MSVYPCYTSAGCNRTPCCMDWGRNGLIVYGSCNAVALFQPHINKTKEQALTTFVQHQDRVNCVKWIPQPHSSKETEFISGSTDKTVIVWKAENDHYNPNAVLVGHKGAVSCVDGLYLQDNESSSRTVVVSSAADSTVKVWLRKKQNESFECIQTLAFGNGFALAVALISLPVTNTALLACGCDDHRIHLFAENQGDFVKVQSLLGHEDWVRALSFACDDGNGVLLASSSQDSSIRIWKILPSRKGAEEMRTEAEDITLQEKSFSVYHQEANHEYNIILESVLYGHDNWVYGIQWQPAVYSAGKDVHQPMCLLSASIDKTMILWKPEVESGVWIEDVRVGDVGGNTLGFFGGKFSPDGSTILGHGYQGDFQMWELDKASGTWTPQLTISGHFDAVQDLAWDPEGHFLVSTSTDQTTRLHAPWVRDEGSITWHEVGRPQIHGYDMQAIAMIDSYSFASAGDEKVIRTFEAPVNFLENLGRISQIDISEKVAKRQGCAPQGASVPALGLSNKAIYQEGSQKLYEDGSVQPHPNEQYSEAYFQPFCTSKPPTEVNLLQNTLWPETQKLYGHGYEVFSLACNPQATILASACKASKAEHAVILLWDATTWRQIGSLSSHSLTITQMSFTHNGEFLLSVSRDRTWSLFQHTPDKAEMFIPVAYTDKKSAIHSRIIWSCAWSHDDKYFATSSRDKKVIIWGTTTKKEAPNLGTYGACSKPLELTDSATAVDFAPELVKDKYLLAIGLDNGRILLFSWNSYSDASTTEWNNLYELNNNFAHHLTVKCLKFRRQKRSNNVQLASGGTDHLVRIYNMEF